MSGRESSGVYWKWRRESAGKSRLGDGAHLPTIQCTQMHRVMHHQ